MTNNYKLLYYNIKNKIKGGATLAASGGSLGPTDIESKPDAIMFEQNSIDEITDAFKILLSLLSKYIKEKNILIFTQNDHSGLLALFTDKFMEHLAIILRFGFHPEFFSFDSHLGEYPLFKKFHNGCNAIRDSLNDLIDDDGSTIILIPGDSPYKIWFCISSELKPNRSLVFPLSKVENYLKVTNLDRFYQQLFRDRHIKVSEIKKIIFFDKIGVEKRGYQRTSNALRKILRRDPNIKAFNINDKLSTEGDESDKIWTEFYLFYDGGDRCQPKYEVGDTEINPGSKIVLGTDKIDHLSPNQVLKCNIALLALIYYRHYTEELKGITGKIYTKYPVISDSSIGSGICRITYFDWITQHVLVTTKCSYIATPCKNKSVSQCIEVYDMCTPTEQVPLYLSTRNLINFEMLLPCKSQSIGCKDHIDKEYKRYLESSLFDITYYSDSKEDGITLKDCLIDEFQDKMLKIFTEPYGSINVLFICYLSITLIRPKESYNLDMSYFYTNPKYYSRISSALDDPPKKFDLFSRLESDYLKKTPGEREFYSSPRRKLYTEISNIDNVSVGSIIIYHEYRVDSKSITSTSAKLLCRTSDNSSILIKTEDENIITINWSISTFDALKFYALFEEKQAPAIPANPAIPAIPANPANP